jgi:formylglycine-generating enzyme required for sulfatase activity
MPDAVTLKQAIKSMLPEPFEWCEIPAGAVEIVYGEWKQSGYQESEKKTYQVDTFWIAKYPLTVSQFEPFVDAGGYKIQDFWSDEGWNWLQSQKFESPRYWKTEKWHVSDYPIVHIIPSEARAYLKWLSQETGLELTLPTEQQWQRAAQGDDERIYPWGNEFKQEFANTYESKIDKITSVTQYPDNMSPYGVMDMSGNVWEFTSSTWQSDIPLHNSYYNAAARGGSYYSGKALAKCTVRKFAPGWDHAYGFRIALGV